jgi:cytidylate kinase
MKTRVRNINQIVEEQMQKWQLLQPTVKAEKTSPPVITLSRQAGSGGNTLAKKIAEDLGFDLFHQEVIHEMAQSSKVSARLLETLDERGVSILEDWINSLVHEKHLWPDQYLKHLLKVIGTIDRHGAAVLIGRGANFILPKNRRFRVRVVAPKDYRIGLVAKGFKVSKDTASARVNQTESNRKTFIRKYFNADIADPINYDLTINTGELSIEAASAAVKAGFSHWRKSVRPLA